MGGPCQEVPEGSGCHFLGGWWLSRSAVVKWDGIEGLYFYRCGDEHEYQLAWSVPDEIEFDRPAYAHAATVFSDHLEAHHGDAAQHIVACERVLACRGLERLLLGVGVHEVVADLSRGMLF